MAKAASSRLGGEASPSHPQPSTGPQELTWEEGNNPLLGILLATFNRELIQKLHLGRQTDRQTGLRTLNSNITPPVCSHG